MTTTLGILQRRATECRHPARSTVEGLTDIDLDCAEAITLAPHYLPKTPSYFGRASKAFSHFLYYIEDAPDKGAVQLKDIDGKRTIN